MKVYSQEEIDRIRETKGKVEFTDEEIFSLLELAEQFDIEVDGDGTVEKMKSVISHDHFHRWTRIYGRIYF